MVPEVGVASWLIMSLFLAIILYFTSKMISTQRPNMMRFFALVMVLIAATQTIVQSLILIYAMPVKPPTVFSLLAGMMTIAFIPYALLILVIAKSYVAVR